MSTFVRHLPCDKCGSSDGNALYTDGHTYCHICKTSVYPDNKHSNKGDNKVSSKLIEDTYLAPLKARKISLDTVEKYGYSCARHRGKLIQLSPYYYKGSLVAQHTRDADKNFSWRGEVSKLELFGQHLFREGGKYLTITEGEIDAMSISQSFGNKYPVVSLPNGAQSALKYVKQNLDFIESYENVILAFDDDEEGHKATESIANLISIGKVKVMTFGGFKDANEALKAGAGSKLPTWFFEAKLWRPDGVVSGYEMRERVKQELPVGYSIPLPKLNKMTKGIRPGELLMITAGSGIGKSTVGREILYDMKMNQKLTVGVMALEESVVRSADIFRGMYLNKIIHLDRSVATDIELDEASEAVLDDHIHFFDHFGSSQIDILLGKMRYMVKALNVQTILLDHVSIVVSGNDDDERKSLDILMTKLRTFIEETGVAVVAIVHLKRPGQGKSYNEGRKVSLSDLRGSASLEQLSDIVIAMERNQQSGDPNVAKIRVLKNRPTGLTGLADTVEYNPKTGRLTVAEGYDEDDDDMFSEESPDI